MSGSSPLVTASATATTHQQRFQTSSLRSQTSLAAWLQSAVVFPSGRADASHCPFLGRPVGSTCDALSAGRFADAVHNVTVCPLEVALPSSWTRGTPASRRASFSRGFRLSVNSGSLMVGRHETRITLQRHHVRRRCDPSDTRFMFGYFSPLPHSHLSFFPPPEPPSHPATCFIAPTHDAILPCYRCRMQISHVWKGKCPIYLPGSTVLVCVFSNCGPFAETHPHERN